ncbi:MAG: ribosome silencing factor [Holophagaceae bacterium]|jgi:ribosome-associated protein|nr:ribosome silencing factor [Acidobacteriota bacterium]
MTESLLSLPIRLRGAIMAAQSKKSFRIKVLHLQPLQGFADYMIFLGGGSDRQNRAIADAISEHFKDLGEYPLAVEGMEEGNWVALDFSDLVFHVMNEETRRFYALENLWKDAPKIEIPEEIPPNPLN